MMVKVKAVFYCRSLHAHVGIMGVQQSFIASAQKYFGESDDVLGCDYESYYRIRWVEGESRPVVEKIEGVSFRDITPEVASFYPIAKFGVMLCEMLRLRRAGAHVSLQTWGFFSDQQSQASWEGGRFPPQLKKWIFRGMKWITAPLVDSYFVSGKFEAESSKLPADRCLGISYGPPTSDLSEAISEDISPTVKSLERSGLIFVGRGRWEEKGIRELVDTVETNPKLELKIFASKPDMELQESARRNLNRIDYDFETYGADLLSALHDSRYFVSLSRNPVQIRGSLEALSAGCGVIVYPEAFMDEYRDLLEAFQMAKYLQIVQNEAEFESAALQALPLGKEVYLRRLTELLNSKEHFSCWLGQWVESPENSFCFYQYIRDCFLDLTHESTQIWSL